METRTVFGNIARGEDGIIHFAGRSVQQLAEQYGTPLYLMDEGRIRANCRMYLEAMKAGFGARALPLYASKAASFKQMYRIMAQEGMGVDTVSSGEIYTAVSAGFPPERIYFHGDCKTDADISYAIEAGIGYFVVDNPEELIKLSETAAKAGIRQKILLRVTPGIDPHTYDAVSTGKVDSKFGAAIETGQAKSFAALALEQESLELQGLHCHVGSQVFDEDVFERAVDIMMAFIAELRDELGYTMEVLNLGGGYGVRYLESDKEIDIPRRISELAARVKREAGRHGLPLPYILMEPGRSIVADAGMTVYTVGSVKRIPGYKNYIAVDGGMTDNPRYALYGAAYTVLHAAKCGKEAVFDLVGRCCESGDIIQPEVSLPEDSCRGDLICVCTTGAYNYSMASNYNRVPRPPVLMLNESGDYLAVRRETIEDLCTLDI